MTLRIDNIDPQGELALSLLREAAAEVRPLYSSSADTAMPGNTGLGPRDVYVAAMVNDIPVGCGSIREVDGKVRRMYVQRDYRRRHVGHAVLLHLMSEARRLDYQCLCLETGNKQPGAMALYESLGFRRVAPFGEYMRDPTSVCYELRLDETGAADPTA